MEFVNFAKGARGWPRVRTRLDGVFFRLEAVWNNVETRWGLAIYLADGRLLRSGLPMRHGEDLLSPFAGPEFPGAGLAKLRVWDTTGQQRDPGRDDLGRGSDVRLIYIPLSEVV